jgi:fused signal recognition particle receptor
LIRRLSKKKYKVTTKEGILAEKLQGIIKGGKNIFEEIEKLLIEADIGPSTVYDILEAIREDNKRIKNYKELTGFLKAHLTKVLDGSEGKLNLSDKSIILIYGVNGVGKTTTVAKLARYLTVKGKKVALVAGDTYRAAGGEQLDVWANRLNVKIYKQGHGADPGAVIFDAITSFKNKKEYTTLIIDTGGRLHTNENLVNQFSKIIRVIRKAWGKIPDERLLVLDGTMGQNTVNQVNIFSKVIDINGIIMTKLDGTAKGGILIRIFKKYNIKIKFLGMGEKIGDLEEFRISNYLERLF